MADTTLSKVSVWMYHTAGDTFTVTANVYALDGSGNPTGASLGSDSLNESDIDEAPGGWVDFTFTPSITVTEGVQYGIIFTSGDVNPLYGNSVDDIDIPGALNTMGSWSAKTHKIRSRVYIAGALSLENNDNPVTGFGLINNTIFVYYFGLFPTIPVTLAKAANPDPADTETGVRKGTTQISWDVSAGATSYDVYFGEAGSMVYVGNVAVNYLSTILAFSYGTNYAWRVDARNETDIVEGDVWTFSTEVFAPPVFNAADPNMMVTQRRLLVAADNKLFYET